MADTKISALTGATTPLAGTEVVPLVQSSTTKNVSVANLTAGRTVNASSFSSTGGSDFATSSGNVGVGISSPSGYLANKLVINTGTDSNNGITIASATNRNGSIWFADGTTGNESYRGGIDYQHTTDTMYFYVGSQGYWTMTSGGDLNVTTGNLVIGTSGKGIDFSANSHASGMTSETLTWYEEGTWTPTSTTLTFGGSPTYTGHYVRIGRLVNINLRIQDSSITSSGAVISAGFPFVSASIMTTVPVANVSNNALLGGGFITVSGGNTIIYLPNFTALTDVSFSGFYFV